MRPRYFKLQRHAEAGQQLGRDCCGPAAAFKGPPRGRAAGLSPGAVSRLRLRTVSQRSTGFRENAPGEEGKVALGGRPWEESAPYANNSGSRGLGGGACDAKSRPSLEARGGGPCTLGLFPRVSDVADVSFKSGRAGAVSRNANLGCYTTGGVRSRRPPGSQSASPP